MPRSARRSVGGEVYHVLNRAALRHPIFKPEKDFAAFEKLLYEANDRVKSVRVLGKEEKGSSLISPFWGSPDAVEGGCQAHPRRRLLDCGP